MYIYTETPNLLTMKLKVLQYYNYDMTSVVSILIYLLFLNVCLFIDACEFM